VIYFIRDSTSAVKIGMVGSLARLHVRLEGLRCGSPHRLTVESVIDGDLAAEREWHSRYVASRLRGEWFGGVDVPLTTYDVTPFSEKDRRVP